VPVPVECRKAAAEIRLPGAAAQHLLVARYQRRLAIRGNAHLHARRAHLVAAHEFLDDAAHGRELPQESLVAFVDGRAVHLPQRCPHSASVRALLRITMIL